MKPASGARIKVALLTHSTNPRGGVVHALELGEALTALGHEAVVHAPDPTGGGFFRHARCRIVSVAARPVDGDLAALVEVRIEDYLAHFSRPHAERFDIYHAHDGISACALATLAERGVIGRFARTVHHLDHFADAQLAAWQHRSVERASHLFCVSQIWRDALATDFGLDATVVGNGVNTRRFTALPSNHDDAVKARFGIGDGPVFLAVGGIEERKNTLRILAAFLHVQRALPHAQLLVVGGASLLDHAAYRAMFDAALGSASIVPARGGRVFLAGPVPDADMPALYRSADALVFASLREGFGLAVLEAMACGTPTVVSHIAPFTEYLGQDDCFWADPVDPASIAAAMRAACEPAAARVRRDAGFAVAGRHAWAACARRHLPAYAALHATTQGAFAHA